MPHLIERILAWLDANNIAWSPCGEFANENVMASWCGQVYVTVPYEETLPVYRQLRDFLEYPDGSVRHAGVRFLIMTLATANRNSQHDKPGYLDNIWAARFSVS